MDWKQYQEEVSNFFKDLGVDAVTNYMAAGARGSHAIDVYVSFKKFGIEITWICECKLWNSAIPKDKVLTLYEIAKDIGADRGFLFSETGFQSGAIKSTKNTNITLTCLEDIREIASEEFAEIILVKSLKWCNNLREKNKPFWLDDLGAFAPLNGVKLDDSILIDGTLMFISLEIQKALNNKYPVVLPRYCNTNVRCADHKTTIHNINIELKLIEDKINSSVGMLEECFGEIANVKNAFINSVDELLAAGEAALFAIDEMQDNDLRLECVQKMKSIGKDAEHLKLISRGSLKQLLSSVMKLLIDTIYLHLCQEKIERTLWNTSKKAVHTALFKMQDVERY